MNVTRRWGPGRFIGLATGLALALAAHSAAAQSLGEAVRIETEAGVVEGTLIDRLPDGYLVRVGDKTEVIRYAAVKSIAPAPSAPQPPAEETPAAALPTPAPTSEPAPPPSTIPPAISPAPPPASPPPRRTGPSSPGLVAGGTAAVAIGTIGLVTGAVLLPIGLAVASEKKCHDPSGSMTFDCEYGNASDMTTAGIIALAGGAVFVIGGIVMIVAGTSRAARQGRSTQPLWFVSAAPRGGNLGWSF